MSLSSAEWKLLHRVMDRVDARRAGDGQADLVRVKSLVMDLYREQGISVDEATIEKAIHEASQAQHDEGSTKPSADSLLQKVPMKGLEKAEKSWRQSLRNEDERRRREEMERNPLARLNARIEAKLEPFLKHQPMTDGAIARELLETLKFKTTLFKVLAWVAAACVAGSGVSVWITFDRFHAFMMEGHGLTASAAAFGFSILLFFGFGQSLFTRRQAGGQAMVLVRALKALTDEHYSSADLKEGMKIAGKVALGSLEPVGEEYRRKFNAQVKNMALDDPMLGATWESWDFEAAPMRINDVLTLKKINDIRNQHPIRALRRLRELNKRRGAS